MLPFGWTDHSLYSISKADLAGPSKEFYIKMDVVAHSFSPSTLGIRDIGISDFEAHLSTDSVLGQLGYTKKPCLGNAKIKNRISH